jgi:4'-phosphopantetheinyl transferase
MTGAITWLTQAHTDLPASLDWLAADERARLDGMRVAKRRADYLLGRWTAKQAIAARLMPAPPLGALAIRAAADGAPEAFIDGAPLALTVSISHSAGRALAAVRDTTAALGADLERVEPRSQLLVNDFFTLDEAAQVRAYPQELRDCAITLIWSAKESALKALRCGLREDPRRARVVLGGELAAAEGPWRALAIATDRATDALTGWWRHDAGYVITVVGPAIAAPPERCVSRAA